MPGFLLRDLLHGTLYRPNFVAHPLIARLVAVLKHFFYFLSFIPSDNVGLFYSLNFSLAYFIILLLGAPEPRMGAP